VSLGDMPLGGEKDQESGNARVPGIRTEFRHG
jgi:hypothetical protein